MKEALLPQKALELGLKEDVKREGNPSRSSDVNQNIWKCTCMVCPEMEVTNRPD